MMSHQQQPLSNPFLGCLGACIDVLLLESQLNWNFFLCATLNDDPRFHSHDDDDDDGGR